MKWKYTKFAVPSDLLSITKDMLDTWKKETEECDKFNENLYSQAIEKLLDMIETATEIWGKQSNVVKYLKNQRIEKPRLYEFEYLKKRIEDARKLQENKERSLEIENTKRELIEKAIVFLTGRDMKLIEDFNIENAIRTANTIAFDEEVEKSKKEMGYIRFVGDSNCENCRGWDGVSHRCDCGNRRVSWVADFDDDFFIDPIIYAEAY